MRTALILLLTSTAALASTANYHYERAAQMMVDADFCQINYDTVELQKEMTKGALDAGENTQAATMNVALAAAALADRINKTVGKSAYCLTRT